MKKMGLTEEEITNESSFNNCSIKRLEELIEENNFPKFKYESGKLDVDDYLKKMRKFLNA